MDMQLETPLRESMARTLPVPRGRHQNDHKLSGASLSSPETTRPPSSNNSVVSSRSNSVGSSRGSTPGPLVLLATSSNSGSWNRGSLKSSDGSKCLAAHSAARDLRSFSQTRRRSSLETPCSLLNQPEALHASPVPMAELLLDLQGGNGRWKKRQAEEEIVRRNKLQAEKDLQLKHERDILQQQRKDEQDWLMKTLQEQEKKIKEISEHDRLEEECQEKRRAEIEQKRLQIKAENARRKQLQQPTPCDSCGRSGKCPSCSGSGCISVSYLSSNVGDASQAFRGQTLTGCTSCAGRRDGAELLKLDVIKGHGRCVACNGYGKTWLSAEEVEAAMQQSSSD